MDAYLDLASFASESGGIAPLKPLSLSRLLKKSLLECFVTGHDFSRADKSFIFLPEPALAGGTGPCLDFSAAC